MHLRKQRPRILISLNRTLYKFYGLLRNMEYQHVGLEDTVERKKVANLLLEGKIKLVDTIEAAKAINTESVTPLLANFAHAEWQARSFADLNIPTKLEELSYEPNIVLVKEYKEGNKAREFWASAVVEVYVPVEKQDNGAASSEALAKQAPQSLQQTFPLAKGYISFRKQDNGAASSEAPVKKKPQTLRQSF